MGLPGEELLGTLCPQGEQAHPRCRAEQAIAPSTPVHGPGLALCCSAGRFCCSWALSTRSLVLPCAHGNPASMAFRPEVDITSRNEESRDMFLWDLHN